MKLLILDNYDSFTYNLVFMIRELGYDQLEVVRNDQIDLNAVNEFDKILLSPGPGLPSTAGIMQQLISNYASSKSILGICLGHQGIGEVFGAKLFNLPRVLHGVAGSMVVEDNSEILFSNMPKKFKATHYHSWAIEPESLPPELVVTIKNDDGMIILSHQSGSGRQ